MVHSRRATGRVPKLGQQKSRQSSGKANAIGYQKRLSQKAKAGLTSRSIDDVYEYQPVKSRRANVRLDLDRDEAREYGIGPGGEIGDNVDREGLRAKLFGEVEDDEKVASEDDEEIDSDGAFEESDEDRFAGFFSSKKNKQKPSKKPNKKVRFAEVDLNEDSDEDDNMKVTEDKDESDEDDEEIEGEEDEFISLLDVLDGKGEIDMGDEDMPDQPLPHKSKSMTSSNSDGGEDRQPEDPSDEEDEDEDEEDEDAESEDDQLNFAPSEDDEDEPDEALQELETFITSLDPSDKKRKTPSDSDATTPREDGPKRKKRQVIKERTEAGTENEFRAQSAGSKLKLEDLLASLPSNPSLQFLKKSTKDLTSTSAKSGKKLSAPLPHRTQERIDREAAYEQTKGEVNKWKETMKQIRDAEHLSFPLQDQKTGMGRVSNLELTAKFKPTTELETSIDALLKSANLRDESSVTKTETHILQSNNLTLEEVAERRAELRKMRSLMFRAELKARRMNKIKSKTYRRLKRKEKESLAEKLRDADGDDSEEGEEERLKREVERARERATLKHKHTGKWAKQMKAKGGTLDENERKEMEEMLVRGEKLRRKIKGVGSDESSNDEDESDEDGEVDEERIKQSAFDEIQKVNEKDAQLEASLATNGSNSVFNMKFMRNAMAREKAAADKIADDFVKEMAGIDQGASDGGEDASEDNKGGLDGVTQDPSTGVVSQRMGGRVMLHPGAKPVAPRLLGSFASASDTSSVTLKSTDLLSPPPNPSTSHGQPFAMEVTPTPTLSTPSSPVLLRPFAEELNPWLTRPEAIEASSKAARKNEIIVDKDSKAADKSKNKLKKVTRKLEVEKAKAKDDAKLEIDKDKVLVAESRENKVMVNGEREDKGKGKAKAPTPVANTVQQDIGGDEDDSDVNSEVEEQETALEARKSGRLPKAFEQRDLVAQAFAGDNVVEQFEEAKRLEIEADAPKEVDTTLPGWGSWGGKGIRKAPPKPSLIKKIAGINPTARADHNKAHVIISERRDKKASKYLVKDLPFPYTSRAQFERSMERPLGIEWNTRVGFQRGTLPKVVTKPGTVITPLKKHHS
ncbi:hypothetical protein AMATHDRAFT_181790 [Amanita thiersii Skay4041]|uniref:Uncharacterized protein n=1 Tax=Amanita thiersii Skay4041 TaxID=703135 RepID=A0A2A9NH53_9AGAR|nr:hypothetical protein AMATHDRAFT_181790 [Amanita thiersii Skay4041]